MSQASAPGRPIASRKPLQMPKIDSDMPVFPFFHRSLKVHKKCNCVAATKYAKRLHSATELSNSATATVTIQPKQSSRLNRYPLAATDCAQLLNHRKKNGILIWIVCVPIRLAHKNS